VKGAFATRLAAALPGPGLTSLALGGLVAVAAALAVWSALDPDALDWSLTSVLIVVALVGAVIVGYGARSVSAHELSLVAAPAAIATASRVLFASLPNVKPVTFIVLVSGVALGPGPGFMVGATSALVSNLFFGQGPWTPWQMLGWGLVGAAGGLLGARGRRPGRWELVVAGGLLALAFDWLVTFWMFLAFTAKTWPAFIALYAQGLPFDLAHVAATGLFAGLFGVRAVTIVARFRARTRVTFVGLEDQTC
jgi:energy-coupling factor transport system substrate-specific component